MNTPKSFFSSIRGVHWIFFAALFLIASIFQTPLIMPGIAILFFVVYYASRFFRDLWQHRIFSHKSFWTAAILMFFLALTPPGRFFWREALTPFMVLSWEKQFKKNPDNLLLARHLSTYYVVSRRTEKAKGLLEFLLEKNPCDTTALSHRALLLRLEKKYEESLENCQRLISCDSTSAVFLDQLGMAYDALGKKDSAVTAWKKALRRARARDKLYERIEEKIEQRK